MHIQNKRFSTCLSRAWVATFAGSSVQDRKKKGGEGVRGDRLHWRVQESTSSLTGDGSMRRVFEVLRNLECPVGLSQKRNMCAFQLRICDTISAVCPKKLWSYMVFLNLVG